MRPFDCETALRCGAGNEIQVNAQGFLVIPGDGTEKAAEVFKPPPIESLDVLTFLQRVCVTPHHHTTAPTSSCASKRSLVAHDTTLTQLPPSHTPCHSFRSL